MLAALTIFAFGGCLSGCSPIYVMRAALEEGEILLNREEIEEALKDHELDSEMREKLQLVLEARAFSKQIGLDAGDSFTQFTKVDRDILAYVLLASKKDAFEPYTWWYPIVGTVPYKGFFEVEDARCVKDRLEAKGYETWVRGTEAFSTLGWFNDPVLSTTLRHPKDQIVNTVLHEIFHQTLWVPGSVDFNESLANVVGSLGAIHFFEHALETCDTAECLNIQQTLLAEANESWNLEKELGSVLTKLFEQFSELYKSELPFAEKMAKRDEIFKAEVASLKDRHPKMQILQNANNAEILQLFLYRKKLPAFEKLFLTCEKKWPCFIEKVKNIADAAEEDPFQLLTSSEVRASDGEKL